MKLLFSTLLLFSFSFLSAQKDLEKLKSWMVGSFDSHQQAAKDSNYYNISLHMYEIWPERSNGNDFWLYVEQAVAKIQGKPYRQRIYHVIQIDDKNFLSEIYEFPNPKEWVLKWKNPSIFSSLKTEELTKLEGCGVHLNFVKQKRAFTGSTNKADCKNNFRGASYATSEVKLTKKQMESWDRGYNADDIQIWGAENGPYIFKKIKI